MNLQKWHRQQIKLIPLFTSLLLLSSTTIAQRPTSQKTPKTSPSPTSTTSQQTLRINLPSRGAPGNRQGAAGRSCGSNSTKFLTALVPKTNFGQTLSEYPIFWLYVPSNGRIKFVLEDEQTQTKLYETWVSVDKAPGLISFQLSSKASLSIKKAPPLLEGKAYRWQFLFFCTNTHQEYDDSVDGVIKRVQASTELLNQLEAARTSRERIMVYTENGIWHEALTGLARLLCSHPQDAQLKTDWNTLFQAAGLEELASDSLADCSKLSNNTN